MIDRPMINSYRVPDNVVVNQLRNTTVHWPNSSYTGPRLHSTINIFLLRSKVSEKVRVWRDYLKRLTLGIFLFKNVRIWQEIQVNLCQKLLFSQNMCYMCTWIVPNVKFRFGIGGLRTKLGSGPNPTSLK